MNGLIPRATPAALLAAFIGCCLVWGSTFMVISVGDEQVPPFWAAAIRLALACVLLTAITRLSGQRLPRGAAARAAATFGFLNFGLGFCLLYWGEQTVPSGLAAVLYGTIPLTTALLAWGWGLERLIAVRVAGAIIAFAGVASIFSGQIGGRAAPLSIGALFCAATLASVSGVVLKSGPRQSPIGANAVAAAVGFMVCLAASFLAREPHAFPATSRGLFSIMYLTLAGSVGAFVLYAWLVNHWALTRISFISVVVPIVALVFGTTLRHERLTAAHWIGSLLVLAGLLLALLGGRGGADSARTP
jgi:drug/metabolite transporter (DMT)-like permease